MSLDLKSNVHQINLTAVTPTSPKVYEFQEFRLDVEHLMLYRRGEELSLTPKQVETLLALVEHSGEIVSKDALMDRVWGNAAVEESNLVQNIYVLRKTLGENPDGSPVIETLRRRGYRFNGGWKENRSGIQGNIDAAVSANARTTGFLQVPLAEHAKTEYGFWRRIKEHKLVAEFAIVATFIGASVAGYLYINRIDTPSSFEAGQITRLTSSGRVKNAVISPDAKFFIYAQEENNEQQSLWVQHIGSESNVQVIAPANVEYRSLIISPDGNSLYYHDANGSLFRMAVWGGIPKKIADGLLTRSRANERIAVSPDGSQIAFVRHLKGVPALVKADADGANEQLLASIKPPDFTTQILAWSPDGKIIACWAYRDGKQGILAVQADDGMYSRMLQEDWVSVINFAWLPNSSELLAIGFPGNQGDPSIWQVSYPAGDLRRITNDSNDYYHLNSDSDGGSLLAVRTQTLTQIWKTTIPDDKAPEQLTTGFDKSDGTATLNWINGGKIFYNSIASGKYSIWVMEADGKNQLQLVKEAAFATVSPDGRYLINDSGSVPGLKRMDLADGSVKQLTSFVDICPTFSSDGKWVVFQRAATPFGLWKIPIDGGEPTQIAAAGWLNPAISPDGSVIAAIQGGKVGLLPFNGGEVIKTFDIAPERNLTTGMLQLHWTPDGRGIYFVALKNGVSNLWKQPVDGSSPVQVTSFESGRIFNFVFSPEGDRLAVSRGSVNSDVVLIKNSAQAQKF
jgi:Tol biopolymer transport system component/DNA-binding winged helix-turn-helix (wHTH) protein